MNILELRDTINKALREFSQENKISVEKINILRNYEYGNPTPIGYEVSIEIK